MLAKTPATKRYGTRDYITELAETGGSRKLIGGQVMDLEGEGKKLTKRDLVRIHEAKTAALLTTSLRLGAMTANATPAKLEALTKFGHNARAGVPSDRRHPRRHPKHRSARQDRRQGPAVEKSTYPAILGLDASRKEAAKLTQAAMDALKPFGAKATRLREIATHLLKRDY